MGDSSDEEMYITQNSFISAEITESDVIPEDGSDFEERFDRWLGEAELQERVRQSVPVATRYKDEWAVKTFENWRSNREKMALRDNSVACFKTPLQNMTLDELNESISYFVFEVKKQDGTEYPANSLHGMVCAIQRYLKSECGKNVRFFNDDFFSKLRTSLDTVMKERSAAGIGVHCKICGRLLILRNNPVPGFYFRCFFSMLLSTPPFPRNYSNTIAYFQTEVITTKLKTDEKQKNMVP